MSWLKYIGVFAMAFSTHSATALEDELNLNVSVATNFLPLLTQIADSYKASHDVNIAISSGSSGKLYSQITHGKPTDLFFSADEFRVDRLIELKQAIPETRVTYAIGSLVLWEPNPGRTASARSSQLLAIAQPELAPYGRAAKQSLENCNVIDREVYRIAYGENIGQTFAMVATGNADAGLVALASLVGNQQNSNIRRIDANCHSPIRQDAIVLVNSHNQQRAKHFLEFVTSPSIKSLIRLSGYPHS